MRFIEKTMLIERLDQLIRLKSTGSARDLADRVGVSKSTIYDIIEVMKSMGAEIDYCPHRKSYYYTQEKILAIGFVDSKKIKGGKKMIEFQPCPVFSDKYGLSLKRRRFQGIFSEPFDRGGNRKKM